MTKRLKADSKGYDVLRSRMGARFSETDKIAKKVEQIKNNLICHADDALRKYTQQFDGHHLDHFLLSTEKIIETADKCPKDVRRAIDVATERIKSFHRKNLPENKEYKDAEGICMGVRYTPMQRVGVYVPGGLAAYPSSILMNVIPAQVAGVAEIVLCTPTPNSYLNPAVMYAVQHLNISEVYTVGGAQAIVAMAYGTETVQAVDFIAGPGNAYVVEAKKQVFGKVGIDSLAGPSEVTVLADCSANARWVAWDLLAQAEHDILAQSILLTDDACFATQVESEIEDILKTLPRAEIARKSWNDFGVIVLCDHLDQAPKIIDLIAPEHLIIATENPQHYFARINHAGSVFLGHYSAEALGDYCTGPNHVLPTSGSARFSSALSAESFMKKTTYQQVTPENFAKIADTAITLAKAEGLDAHAGSLIARQPKAK